MQLAVRIPQFARFTISSLVSAGIDFLFFYLISLAAVSFLGLDVKDKRVIFAATVGARIVSTVVNFTINKIWAFESKKSAPREIALFAVLFVAKMCASAALVSAFSFVKISTTAIKIFVDTALFFVSFAVQKLLIFR